MGNLAPTLCVFVGHEFGVSGHGDDRRPYRRAWACPCSIVSLTTGKRFRAAIGTVLIWLAGTSSYIGTSCGGRPRRSIPKPRPLTLHKIARQAYSTLSRPGLRLPMTFSGRLTIPPGRSATKAFSIRPSPNIPPSVSRPVLPPDREGRCRSTHRARDRADRRATAAATKTRHGPCASQRLFNQVLSG